MSNLPVAGLVREAVLTARCLAPAALPARIVVTVEIEGYGVAARVLVPAADTLAPPPAPAPPPPTLSEMEGDVLQALEEAGEVLTGEQIAERTGYPWDATLRQALAAMRRRGLLTGRPGERGYGVATRDTPSV